MGPSGAGKTTLMSALAHRSPVGTVVDGEIAMNGHPVGDFMHQESGYMHQDELFVDNLTVIEHLTIMLNDFTAEELTFPVMRIWRMGHDPPQGPCVDCWVLTTAATYGGVRDTNFLSTHPITGPCPLTYGSSHLLIGTQATSQPTPQATSPIQKQIHAYRRIGRPQNTFWRREKETGVRHRGEDNDFIKHPGLLFCDEPTTGLDSSSAQKIMELLRASAVQGKTVICTIHQPSSELMALFDRLVLLAEGRVAFAGHASAALSFFERHPDKRSRVYATVLQLATQLKNLNMEIQLEFHLNDNAEQDSKMVGRDNFKAPFFFTKIGWLVYRYIIVIIRDPRVQLIRILQKLAIALTAGLCFLGTVRLTQTGVQDVQGALFIIIAENTFSPMYSVLHMFPEEFPLLQRELKAGLYSTPMYYIARMVALFPGLIIEPTLFTLIVYWIAGLRSSLYAFGFTVFIAIMVLNVAIACGTLILLLRVWLNACSHRVLGAIRLLAHDDIRIIREAQLNSKVYILDPTFLVADVLQRGHEYTAVGWCSGDMGIPVLSDPAPVLKRKTYCEYPPWGGMDPGSSKEPAGSSLTSKTYLNIYISEIGMRMRDRAGLAT
ncbi:unnamed protein product [Diatraea saccharalis]|uniref:AAA+ ATPase domain-containing protein n=1 Tax=Diatraea saccharalis TaxID=40085 RepID=A0A9N9QUG3_9NEOP|nr:unnamed protein product [Diatraea saccharalis]